MKAVDGWARTPQGRAAIELSQRHIAFVETAREIARSDLDDQAARAKVRECLPGDPELARHAIEHLGALRTSYADDRAYRLLTAAVNDTPVRPIDPAVRDQFLAEAQLGRMSLNDAFEYLASLEPRLRDPALRHSEDPRAKRRGFSISVRRSEPVLVGPVAESPYPIVSTDLARSVVLEYLAVTRGGTTTDQDPTPFFERKRRTFSGTFRVFGKTQPRAEN